MDFVIQVDHVTYSYPLAKEPALKQLNVGIEKRKILWSYWGKWCRENFILRTSSRFYPGIL